MFRLISQVSFGSDKRAAGSFGSPKASHCTPRRYKYFKSALKAALRIPGVHSVMDDNGYPHAVVRDQRITAIIPGL